MAQPPTFKTLTERWAWAEEQLTDCRLCPRQCRVNRSAGEVGWCGAGAEVRYFLEFVHHGGEEAELAPSHTLYLNGCNLRCLFCHTTGERAARPAVHLTAAGLTDLIARGRREGARNLNLLGGEPGVNLPGVLRLLREIEPQLGLTAGAGLQWSAAAGSARLPPLIWNSNFYCAPEVLEAVSGLVALYLPDLKFGCSFCAEALCAAEDYWEVVTARLREVQQREPGKLLLRHLLLPGHFSCCTRPALTWLARELPGVRLSLKRDYQVMPQACVDARLKRSLTSEEAERAAGLAASLGLNYELSAATPCDLATSATCPHGR